MIRVSLEQLLRATGGEAVEFDRRDAAFTGIGIDSRTVRPGELFWAIQGERHDGHHFVAEAMKQGAAGAVISAAAVEATNGPRIVVHKTLSALGRFARWHRRRGRARIVGVTGSVGKTTTREMIHAVLAAEKQGTRSPRNWNNHVGLPLSLLDVEPDHDFAVLELGASRIGEIRELARIAGPEIGVVTAIGLGHLAGFGSIETIQAAKEELIESLPETGVAVLPQDDPRCRAIAERAACRVVLVGEGPQADLQASGVQSQNERLRFLVQGVRFELPVAGRHHLRAALLAAAVGREFGIALETAAEALAGFHPVAGRCRVERIGAWTAIDDTYNANPESMRAACDLLAGWTTDGRRVLVVGEMLELGEAAAECHRELGRQIAAAGIDRLLAVGRFAEDVTHAAIAAGMDRTRVEAAEDVEHAGRALQQELGPGDVVLVKGSRGTRMERVIEQLRGDQQNIEGNQRVMIPNGQ